MLNDVIAMIYSHARGMWRYRWWALITTWIICLGGWLFVYTMEDVYEAQARIYVDTENVLQPLLRGIAVSSNVMDEVNVVTRELLSRPNLAEVARTTDLDLDAQSPQQFENLLTSLGRRIEVRGGRDRIFTISFEHHSRRKAEEVVQSLVDTFVEKSLGADRSDAVQAQEFLQEQIEVYEARLTAAEDRLARFKRENVEFMPGQRGDYFSRLQGAESALQDIRQRLSIAVEEKAELERQISAESSGGNGAANSATTSAFAAAKIKELEAELEVLRLRYTDKHPRIGQILETIELLRQQDATSGPVSTPGATVSTNPVLENMRIQLSNIELNIASLRAEERQRLNDVQSLRRLVDTVPQVEAELVRLNRDYGIVKAKYEQLVQQLETANIGDNVSKSIDDVQFRVIDPPFAPARPVGPNRPLFLAMVAVAAIGVGIGLSFLLNQLNLVFMTNRSVTQVTGLPVLANVSLLENDRQRMLAALDRRMLAAGCVGLVGAFFLVTIFANRGSDVVRNLLTGVM